MRKEQEGAAPAAPAVPVIDAPRVEDELRAALDRLRLKLQFATPSIDKIHEHGADSPLEEAWQIYYDEVMPALALPIARQAQPTDRNDILEEAAKLCEEMEGDMFDQYKGRGKHAPNNQYRADPYMNGQSDGAGQCANAIRAMMRALKSEQKG